MPWDNGFVFSKNEVINKARVNIFCNIETKFCNMLHNTSVCHIFIWVVYALIIMKYNQMK